MRTTLHAGPLVFRIHWPLALGLVLAIAGLARLGLWQLDRAQQKIDQQVAFQAAGQMEPTPLDEVPIAGLPFDAMQHQNRRVVLRGSYLNDRNIFLIYQTYEESIGWEVVTPFRLDDGQVALVSRGWSGIGDVDELKAALPAVPGAITVEGQLYVPTPEQAAQPGDALAKEWPRVQRHLNISEIAETFPDVSVFPYVVRLAEKQPGVLVRHWPVVLVDSGRNFSYALQWFAMAIALMLASVFLSSNLGQLWKERQSPL